VVAAALGRFGLQAPLFRPGTSPVAVAAAEAVVAAADTADLPGSASHLRRFASLAAAAALSHRPRVQPSQQKQE
jgi:cysteine sulfinate desulfinase/cysteine desulfurase-like protein